MIEELISFETAKLASEKKYPQKDCYYRFLLNGEDSYDYSIDWMNDRAISRPTQTLLQKWLRETHNIFVTVEPIYYFKGDNIGYSATVNSLSSKNQGELLLDGFTIYLNYKEALEQGLYESLKLI